MKKMILSLTLLLITKGLHASEQPTIRPHTTPQQQLISAIKSYYRETENYSDEKWETLEKFFTDKFCLTQRCLPLIYSYIIMPKLEYRTCRMDFMVHSSQALRMPFWENLYTIMKQPHNQRPPTFNNKEFDKATLHTYYLETEKKHLLSLITLAIDPQHKSVAGFCISYPGELEHLPAVDQAYDLFETAQSLLRCNISIGPNRLRLTLVNLQQPPDPINYTQLLKTFSKETMGQKEDYVYTRKGVALGDVPKTNESTEEEIFKEFPSLFQG